MSRLSVHTEKDWEVLRALNNDKSARYKAWSFWRPSILSMSVYADIFPITVHMLHFYSLAIWCYKEIAFSSVTLQFCHRHICLVLTSLLCYFIFLWFFFLSFSLVYQCLSVVQMKNHILLLSIYYGVLYFGCVLKCNHAMFGKKKRKKSLKHLKTKKSGSHVKLEYLLWL